MDVNNILSHVDHTLLAQTATWEEIRQLCDDAVQYGTASVCIPPSFVRLADSYLKGQMAVCTVIGFPNGYMTPVAKAFEAKDAVGNGASEIDMVINLGWLRDRKYVLVENEIRIIREACQGKVLKVIVEACLLTRQEKIEMCRIVTETGADYIKTSTGFSTAGATFEDIELFASHVGPGVKIKAAGGIATMEDAERFLNLGADRLGTSRIVKLVKEREAFENE